MLGAVLIVDDDASVRHTARLALAREECGILTASDGHTAIEFMSTGEVASKVCALLCDLEMPQMSGKVAHRPFPDALSIDPSDCIQRRL